MPDKPYNLNAMTAIDPELMSSLLNHEAKGSLQQDEYLVLNEARRRGWMPPPMLGSKTPAYKPAGPAIPPPPSEPRNYGIWERAKMGIAQAGQWANEKVKAFVDTAADTLADPEAAVGTVGGMIPGPVGVFAGSVGPAAVATLREAKDAANEGRMMRRDRTTDALVSGIGAELTGRAINKAFHGVRRPKTPIGEDVERFFGRENTMAHQMTDSAPLDFAANIAKHGPGGTSIYRGVEDVQSTIARQKIDDAAKKLSASNIIIPDKGMAGKAVQQDLKANLKNARAKSGYSDFLRDFGKIAEPDVELPSGKLKQGKSVTKLASSRSNALKFSRKAEQAGDYSAQSKFLGEAKKLDQRIRKVLKDPSVIKQWEDMNESYKNEIRRLDNPTVADIRRGSSDSVIDKVLGAHGAKLKHATPIDTGIGQTRDELLGRVKAALSPEAWSQLQADTIHQLGEKSVNKQGLVGFDEMKKLVGSIDDRTADMLFGPARSDVNYTLSVLDQAQRARKSESGRLFIAIRYGGAAVALASAGTAIASGNAPSASTLAGNAAILLAPNAFARALSSEVGRKLLIRAVSPNRTIAEQAVRALTRFGAHAAAEGARESHEAGKDSAADLNPDFSQGPDAISFDQAPIEPPPF